MASEGWLKKLAGFHANGRVAPLGSNDAPAPMSHALLHTVLHGLALLVIFKLFKWTWTRASLRSNSTLCLDATRAQVNNKSREYGEWTPQSFEYPEVIPCESGLKDIKPIPYRPFRWGEYHVTMGIRSMVWSEWIELDDTYTDYQRVRSFRLGTRGKDVVRVLPLREDGIVKVSGGADAAKELVYELAEYLCRRYPRSFRVTRISSSSRCIPCIGGIPLAWDGKAPIKDIEVKETGARFDLSALDALRGVEMGEEAMKIVTGLVQEDVAIMMEGSDGKYYFQAGSICTPGFWRMHDKIGMSLDEIHLSGNVPQSNGHVITIKDKLETSMERFFRRMALDKPVVRNNYFIQVVRPGEEKTSSSEIDPEELGWSESTNGPEDAFVHGHGHSAEPARYLAPGTLRLRSERQTLRRLPRTGAIVFGIRTYLSKVEELARERGVAGRLASAIRSWPEDVSVYKGRKMYERVLVGYLEGNADGEREERYPY